jgi:thiamine-phosphate pyrophosphorylase
MRSVFFMREIRGFYFITNSALSAHGDVADVRSAVRAGVTVIQYRAKNKNARQMYEQARSIKDECGQALFLINDRIDIAVGLDADGVHLGSSDMPYEVARKILGAGKVIGLSVKSFKEAEAAQGKKADYIGVGPVFQTQTKPDAGNPVGTALIKEIKRNLSIPVVAIGGITLDNVETVIAAGADAVCAVSAVLSKPDVTEEIIKFQSLFQPAKIDETFTQKTDKAG